MSDLTRRLKRHAEDYEQAASQQQGTLAAYWRGCAHGLRMAHRITSNAETQESIRAFMSPPRPPSDFPPNREIQDGDPTPRPKAEQETQHE